MKVITVFNHKGGVGKTTVAFNLGLALGQLGKRVLLADLDPQANLTALALDEERFDGLFNDSDAWTIATALHPLVTGEGDFLPGLPMQIRDKVFLLPGDIRLAEFETVLPSAHIEALAGLERGFRVSSAVYRILGYITREANCDIVICDVGPNIGALNRAVITGSDSIIVPVSSDLFSLRALDTVGKSVTEWVTSWERAIQGLRNPLSFQIPAGKPCFLGYIVQQFGIYGGLPASAYRHWHEKLAPAVTNGIVKPLLQLGLVNGDINDLKLADMRYVHSLAPKAQQNNKAIFELDNREAPGEHSNTVAEVGSLYRKLGRTIISKMAMQKTVQETLRLPSL